MPGGKRHKNADAHDSGYALQIQHLPEKESAA
jgi:hypothetical protein